MNLIKQGFQISLEDVGELISMIEEWDKEKHRHFAEYVNYWGPYIHAEHESRYQKEYENCEHVICQSMVKTAEKEKAF